MGALLLSHAREMPRSDPHLLSVFGTVDVASFDSILGVPRKISADSRIRIAEPPGFAPNTSAEHPRRVCGT